MKYLAALIQAWLRHLLGPALPRVVSVGISICGMVAMATPLAMWVAWSLPVLKLIMIIGMGAVLTIFFLAWLSPDDRI